MVLDSNGVPEFPEEVRFGGLLVGGDADQFRGQRWVRHTHSVLGRYPAGRGINNYQEGPVELSVMYRGIEETL